MPRLTQAKSLRYCHVASPCRRPRSALSSVSFWSPSFPFCCAAAGKVPGVTGLLQSATGIAFCVPYGNKHTSSHVPSPGMSLSRLLLRLLYLCSFGRPFLVRPLGLIMGRLRIHHPFPLLHRELLSLRQEVHHCPSWPGNPSPRMVDNLETPWDTRGDRQPGRERRQESYLSSSSSSHSSPASAGFRTAAARRLHRSWDRTVPTTRAFAIWSAFAETRISSVKKYFLGKIFLSHCHRHNCIFRFFFFIMCMLFKTWPISRTDFRSRKKIQVNVILAPYFLG